MEICGILYCREFTVLTAGGEGSSWACTTGIASAASAGIWRWVQRGWRITSFFFFFFLFYAIPRQDTNETAHRLIQRFGSLQGVLHAAPEELTSVEGVGENAAVLVRLVGDMALRARCSSLPQKVLNSPDRTGAYFMELLAGEKKEMLYQVCLDAKGKLLTCRCISKGSVAASPVSVRQVVENALYAGASSIILAHNHPSGVALPSQQDLLVTRQIQEALSPLNIRLADHVVVADSDYVSMAESGLLAR